MFASKHQASGHPAALGAADGLSLAAAPTFAIMALLTSAFGGGPADAICAAAHASPLGGMVPMYLLMSAFHLAPWLRLVAATKDGGRNASGSPRRRAHEIVRTVVSASPPVDRPLAARATKEIRMPYVDGFVIPVHKDKVEAYKAQARKAGEIWKELGALDFVECIGDDVPYGELTSFPRAVKAKDDEVIVFSWIVYRNRAERDAIMEKIMADPRLKEDDMPFDGKRLIHGGFEMWLKL